MARDRERRGKRLRVVKAERFAFVGAVCGPSAAVMQARGVELQPCDRGTEARVGERQAAGLKGEDSIAGRAAVRMIAFPTRGVLTGNSRLVSDGIAGSEEKSAIIK